MVGINAYSGGISPLQSAVRDASAIAESLKTHHSFDVEVMLDEQAGAAAIAAHLEQRLPEKLDEESAFLFYFAGHGVARGDGSEGPKGFLIPHGAAPGAQDTWLSMDRVREALQALPCKHLLVILDCCFAGSFRWAATRAVVWDSGPLYQSQYERYLKGTAWQALTSASYDEKAMDVSPGRHDTRDLHGGEGHSPFAAALLKGLSGEADSARGSHEPDGILTATELYQYVFEELVPPDAPPNQTPGIWPLKPDNTGQFVFRNPTRPPKTEPDPPLDPENNPWLGLKAYSQGDAPLFFGRERVVEELIEWIVDPDDPRFVSVVGASGTGKSSVVKAGLLPRLLEPREEMAERVGKWKIVSTSRLSVDPSVQLDAAMAEFGEMPAGHRRLLFIDQFEELYTRSHDADKRTRFVQRLHDLVKDNPDLTIIVTLRSDFEPRAAGSEIIGELWARGRYLVPALTIEEFRDCIIGPAQVKAIYFEPDDLVDELLDEVMSMPGALPMLSFALSEMYHQAELRRRETGATDRAITQADHEATGGVVGALHRRASQLYDESDPKTQKTIRQVFLRMISQDGARLARRRIDLRELEMADKEENARVQAVVDRYVKARLLVIDGDEIEPAHDTLVVAWERLLNWLGDARSQRVMRAVWRAASEWDNNKRARGMLWNDNPILPIAAKREELNKLEREFVKASKKKKRRILFRNLFVLGAAASIILTVAGYAIDRALDAEWQRQTRDEVYLEILEVGDFFHVGDVITGDAEGGVVYPLDNGWWTLVNEQEGPFMLGRTYDNGRILAAGHEELIVSPNGSNFMRLAYYWLGGEMGEPIVFSSGHSEALQAYHPHYYYPMMEQMEAMDYRVGEIEELTPETLADIAVLVIGNAWHSFTENELMAVHDYVANGGGLMVAGLGWSWVEHGPLKDSGLTPAELLEIYPMNVLMQPFGLVWTEQPIFTTR